MTLVTTRLAILLNSIFFPPPPVFHGAGGRVTGFDRTKLLNPKSVIVSLFGLSMLLMFIYSIFICVDLI